MKNALALSAAAIALLITSLPVQAAYVVDLTQVGSEVVASGSGSLDTTDLSLVGVTALAPFINPGVAALYLGAGLGVPYSGISGPSDFGSGGANSSAGGSGNVAGIIDFLGEIIVPEGYVSGSPLSSNAFWPTQTFSSLGVTPGTYKWTWGTGAHADSFTLDAVIPEPSTWALMALGFAGLGFAGWRSRRRSVAIAA